MIGRFPLRVVLKCHNLLETKKGVLSILSSEAIKQILTESGVESFEMIPMMRPLSFEHYQNWIAENKNADMDYLEKNSEVREHPDAHFEPMKSMIVFTTPYFPHPQPSEKIFKNLKIAHYAQNKDYHFWFREKLNQLIEKLKVQFPDEDFISFTDAVPLLERDHAVQAGLGWVGKNTCLIHPQKGSLFFIGEILTSLDCNQSFSPMHDFCGSCTACIDECPTDALSTAKVLDSNKCLAYWNIESRDIPPVEIREKMEGWFFGCDICQTVCPWNIKLHKKAPNFEQKTGDKKALIEELKVILTSSNKALMRELGETPLNRAGGRGLKRNALIVIGNLALNELSPEVQAFKSHETLGELAEWTLSKLSET